MMTSYEKRLEQAELESSQRRAWDKLVRINEKINGGQKVTQILNKKVTQLYMNNIWSTLDEEDMDNIHAIADSMGVQ